jgi:hypothetical protein
MKPIYFPFTFISTSVAEMLSACFKQTAVYQISNRNVPVNMQEWCTNGTLDIQFPVPCDEEKLVEILEDYRSWVTLHQGSEIAFLKTQAEKIPFFNETYASQIRTEIKSQGRQDQGKIKPDELTNTLVFLHAAQEFDLQNHEAGQDLLALEELEKSLMDTLKGEIEGTSSQTALSKTIAAEDPGHYMTAERVDAWTRLMQYDQQNFELYITSSKSVLEYLLDKNIDLEMVTRIDAIPVGNITVQKKEKWQDDLINYLNKLAKSSWPASNGDMIRGPEVTEGGRKVSLTLHIAPEKTPLEFFSDYTKSDVVHTKDRSETEGPRHTLIGLFEI